MILENPYPVCEFDTDREPLITPADFAKELPPLPPRCVITFFRRELRQLAEARRREGCLTVEMEAAAFFAVSRYHDIPLGQLLYAGDDVSGEAWDSRSWDSQKGVRANLMATAIRLCRDLPIQKQKEEHHV